ncbi:MAG TPA: hypothetical protein VF608_01740, partial [Thermoanaerobaculia bacterium]
MTVQWRKCQRTVEDVARGRHVVNARPVLPFRTAMKVAFIKPPVGGILGLEMLTFVEPLGPICVAACLEEDGHECKVIDLRIDGEENGLAACRK